MITKHKSKIALAACLLLAQSHGMYGDYEVIGAPWKIIGDFINNLDKTAKETKEANEAFNKAVVKILALISCGIVGGYLLYDGITDHAAKVRWQGIQYQRAEYVKNALDVTQDLQLKLTQEEAQKRAEEKFPGNGPVATPVWKRRLKGGIAAGLLAVTAWSGWSLSR